MPSLNQYRKRGINCQPLQERLEPQRRISHNPCLEKVYGSTAKPTIQQTISIWVQYRISLLMPVKHNVSMQNPDLSGPTTHPRGDVLIKWLSLPRGVLDKHSVWVLRLFAVVVYTSASNITQRVLGLIQYCSKADLRVWFKKNIAYGI